MKKLSFEKILAENMLRFGTKNLGDTVNKLKRLIEGLGSGDAVGNGVVVPTDVIDLIKTASGNSKAIRNAEAQIKGMKIPIKCNTNIIYAIIYGAIKGNAAAFGSGGLLKFLGMKKQFIAKLAKVLDAMPTDSLMFVDYEATITFNPYPEDPTKVATRGEVSTATGIGGDEQAGSDYTELLTYLNTYNLMNCVSTVWTDAGVQQYVLSGKTNDENGFLMLDAQAGVFMVWPDICFYATAKAGVSKAGKTVNQSKFVPVAGTKQDIPIGPDTFPAMKVVVDDAGWTTISDKIDGFNTSPEFGGKGWKISGFTVNSAASLGETVKSANAADFATAAGVPLGDVTAAGITDSNVRDPLAGAVSKLPVGPAVAGRSGQDFLAITRANNIKAKLETAYPGIPITTVPTLAAGKAQGRFGAVTFTVLGPNKEVSIPATMINTGTVGAADDLSKVFNCYRVESDYYLVSMFKSTNIDSDEISDPN